MALQGAAGLPVCIRCLNGDDPYHRFTCSVDGCVKKPVFMAVTRTGDSSPALLCQRHFRAMRDSILSFLEVPGWLVEVDDFQSHEHSVVFEFDLVSLGATECITSGVGEERGPHRSRS